MNLELSLRNDVMMDYYVLKNKLTCLFEDKIDWFVISYV